MKRFILLFLLLPAVSFAQYNQEVTTEESFENSELFFESYYLNSFGLNGFRNAAPGLVNDPFLNLSINPANLPDLGDSDLLLYLDFSGDREESDIVTQYPYPYYYDSRSMYSPTLDPRWISTSRKEPAPIASFGIMGYPLGEKNRNLFIGGTYQLLHKEEGFYSVPYWIYNGRVFYDTFGNASPESNNIPIIDRYAGENEMITTAHLFSAFVGYKFSDDLSTGFSMNGISHSRNGSYLDQSQDEYGNIDYSEWYNYSGQEREQDYSHMDFNFGVNYKLTPKTKLGVKFGILNGTADQTYTSGSEYIYDYDSPDDTLNMNNHFSNSATNQSWNQDGSSKYFNINFNWGIREGVVFNSYYRYTNGSIDLSNSSTIADTSDYYYRWHNDYYNNVSESWGKSSTSDLRNGTGTKDKIDHRGAFNFTWLINENISFTAGVYFNNKETNISSTEPVYVSRYSESSSTNTDPVYNNHYYYKLVEDKTLVWNYTSKFWTLQVPVMLNAAINENVEIMLGINRTIDNWEIESSTIAYFNYRERFENGNYEKEENFGERYTQPTRHYTDNYTEFIAGLKVTISQSLKINLLVNPEFDDSFRVAQWQLSFYGLL